jgi:hypothetical protein
LNAAINFEECDILVPVNLITRRMSDGTLGRVAQELTLVHAKEKAEITDIEAFGVILCWKGSKVPGFKPVTTKLDGFDSLKLGLLDKFRNFFF